MPTDALVIASGGAARFRTTPAGPAGRVCLTGPWRGTRVATKALEVIQMESSLDASFTEPGKNITKDGNRHGKGLRSDVASVVARGRAVARSRMT